MSKFGNGNDYHNILYMTINDYENILYTTTNYFCIILHANLGSFTFDNFYQSFFH